MEVLSRTGRGTALGDLLLLAAVEFQEGMQGDPGVSGDSLCMHRCQSRACAILFQFGLTLSGGQIYFDPIFCEPLIGSVPGLHDPEGN